jgi:hypothetical protein
LTNSSQICTEAIHEMSEVIVGFVDISGIVDYHCKINNWSNLLPFLSHWWVLTNFAMTFIDKGYVLSNIK